MRIHELIEDAKITKKGLEYLSELDERIKYENQDLVNMIKRLQNEKEELKHAFSYKKYERGWNVYETKSVDKEISELRARIDELRAKITAYNNKSWLSRLLSINKEI